MNRASSYPAQIPASEIDQATVRVAKSEGPLLIALGETLSRLFREDRLLQLGYSRQVDYARERLGVPPSTMYAWIELAKGLADKPLLKRAVRIGAVTARKARTVLPVAVGEAEARWTAAATTMTVRELEQAVRSGGKEPPDDSFEFENLWLRMTAGQRKRLDAGEDPAPDWSRSVRRQLCAVDEAACVIASPDTGDALELDARLMRLVEAWRGFDEALGAQLVRVVDERIWSTLGYRSMEEYCRERLDMSASAVRQRARLERKLCALPALREALASGRLTYSKAQVLAKDATTDDVEARIAHATSITSQRLERETTEAEDRKGREAGVWRLSGPADTVRLVAKAIACARAHAAANGERISPGEALARIGDHFVEAARVRS